MALYSFGRVKIVSRNSIKSAVATAAYHGGTEIKNEYDGEVHNFLGKKGVGETYIRMPETAPAAWRDESVPAKERLATIWNAVELASPAQNARLARANYLALQRELTLEQNLECVDRWVKENCTDVGMGVTYTVHLKKGNPHVDVMYLVNEYGPDGKPKYKAKKEYLCRDSAGTEQYMDAAAFKAAVGWEKVYKYQKDGERRDMTPSEAAEAAGWERINKHPVCRTVKVGGWDDPGLTKKWREAWANVLNDKFEELGLDIRVDHRSHKERGLASLPSRHVGWGPGADENREYNARIQEHNAALRAMHQEAVAELKEIGAQIEVLRQQPQDELTIEAHERVYRRREKILRSIAASELLGDVGTTKLKDILDKLHRAFTNLLRWWRERLVGRKDQVREAAQEALQEVGNMRRGLDEILSDATERSKETGMLTGRGSDDFHK